jgi:anti-sigma-K factor RskA
LADVRVGTDADAIGKGYVEAKEKVADLERRLQERNASNEALERLIIARNDELKKFQFELAEERERSELNAKKAAAKEGDAILSAAAAAPSNNSNLLLWAAIGGWMGFIVALAALVAMWSRRITPDPLLDSPPPGQTIPDPRNRTLEAPDRHVIE